mgnify:CR=1 FL=1
MSIFKSGKFSLAGSKWAAMVLVACFCMTVVLGSPIHDHDIDPTHADSDCISCHLVNINIGLQQDNQSLAVIREGSYLVSIGSNFALIASTPSFSSRAPPVTS